MASSIRQMVPTRVAAGLLAGFAALFLFRLATATIVNDDYLHLANAQQVILGAVPVRDFLDPGELLFYSSSAAAQMLFGRSMLSEVLLDAFFLSLGQMLVFMLASQAARSVVVGLLAAWCSVVMVARLYSYPKIFLYAVALALVWQYIDKRRIAILYTLSGWTGLAFLFRHDHGAYIGLTAVLMLLIVHGRDRVGLARDLTRFAVPVVLILIPFFVFVQLNGGILFYLRDTLETARGEYQRTVGPFPSFRVVWTGIVPLLAPAPSHEPDPNATAWLYYVTVSLPPLTLLVLAGDWVRRRVSGAQSLWAGMDHEPSKLVCAAFLGGLMDVYLLRAKSASAIADVSALTAVLGAWLLARGLAAGWHSARALRRLEPWRSWMATCAGLAGIAVAVVVYAITAVYVGRTPGGDQAKTFWETIADRHDPLSPRVKGLYAMRPPYDDEAARYVFACTAPSDRLLVTSGYRPEVYYATGRGFAAGRPYFLSSLPLTLEFKTWSLARLRAERVPIALRDPNDHEFASLFPELDQYVQQHYRAVGQVDFEGVRFDVLADSRILPIGRWAERLPCYR